MQILISIPEAMNWENDKNHNVKKVNKMFKEEIREVSHKYKISQSNIGRGADWIVYILEYFGYAIGVGTVISSLLAYVEIYERLKVLIAKMNEKKYPFFIDIDTATIVCLSKVYEELGSCEEVEILLKQNVSKIDLKSAFFDDRPKERLDSNPFGYYIISIVAKKESKHYTFVFCITSLNKIKFKDMFINTEFEFLNSQI